MCLDFLKESFFKNRGRIFVSIALSGLSYVFEGIGIVLLIPLLHSLAGDPASSFRVKFLDYFYEWVTRSYPGSELVFCSVAILGAILLKSAVGYLSSLSTYALTEKINMGLSSRVFSQLLKLSVDFHQRESRGVLINAINREVLQVSQLCEITLGLFSSVVPLVIYSFLMFQLAGQIMGYVLFYVMILFVLLSRFTKGLKLAAVNTNKPVERVQTVLVESFAGWLLIRLSNAFSFEEKKFNDAQVSSYLSRLTLRKWKLLVSPVLEVTLLLSVLFFINVFVLIKGVHSVGLVLGSIFVMFRMVPVLQRLNDQRGVWVSLIPSLDRLDEIICSDVSVQKFGVIAPVVFQAEVLFDRVNFAYPGRPAILNDFSISIRKGQRVALVGQSGSGKSTVLSLLARFYNAGGGIKIDGVSIGDFSPEAWSDFVGYVTQESFFFSDTIFNNIAYPFYSERRFKSEEIERVAKLAHAHEFISQLPQGYQTVMGERGATLSGGQKQRIALARVLLRNPELLLLDEVTSALDSDAERIVQNAIDQSTHGKTVMMVTHRLSGVMTCDRIVVLKNGGIIEQGTPKELLNLKGVFSEMLRSQGLDVNKIGIEHG